MKQTIKYFLNQFLKNKITLEQFNMELLALNPYMVDNNMWEVYEDEINLFIRKYNEGDKNVFSLDSSLSIINIIPNKFKEEDEDQDY